jgi:ElaB/YqjD/DUF883 family membrane-anchored ribosome-binding protein
VNHLNKDRKWSKEMNTQAAVNNEDKSRVREALETAGKVVEASLDVEKLKKKVENAVEEAVFDAQRLAKHGQYALEDVIDDTTHYIKKNPLLSVGYAAGAGLGIGLLAGWLMTRRNNNTVH